MWWSGFPFGKPKQEHNMTKQELDQKEKEVMGLSKIKLDQAQKEGGRD